MTTRTMGLLAVVLLALAACGDEGQPTGPTGPATEVEWTHVVGAGGAVYYLTGPQQARPPEGTFPPGTKVKLVSEHGSYVRVTSETGQTAYVATGSVEPLGP